MKTNKRRRKQMETFYRMLKSTLSTDAKVFILTKMLEEPHLTDAMQQDLELTLNHWRKIQEEEIEEILLNEA